MIPSDADFLITCARGHANGNETTPCFDIKGTIILNFDLPKVAKVLVLA